MRIIDAQIHVYPPSTPERPWPPTHSFVHGPEYSIEEALGVMTPADVHGAVLVPPGWIGLDSSHALEISHRDPDRFAVMGRFDIDHPRARENLRAFMQPGMIGIRPVFTYPEWISALTDPDRAWFWSDCAAMGIPLMCFFPDLSVVAPLMRRFPGLKLTVDHAGRIPRAAMDEAAWENIGELLALAEFPSAMVKMSSLPCFSTQAFPFPSLHAPIRRILDAFGAERLMWGSDVTRLTCTYDENVRLFTEALDFLSAEDLEWIMGRTLAARCGWPSSLG